MAPAGLCRLRDGGLPSTRFPEAHRAAGPRLSSPHNGFLVASVLCPRGPAVSLAGLLAVGQEPGTQEALRVCRARVGVSTDSLQPCGLLEDSMPSLQCRLSARGPRSLLPRWRAEAFSNSAGRDPPPPTGVLRKMLHPDKVTGPSGSVSRHRRALQVPVFPPRCMNPHDRAA